MKGKFASSLENGGAGAFVMIFSGGLPVREQGRQYGAQRGRKPLGSMPPTWKTDKDFLQGIEDV